MSIQNAMKRIILSIILVLSAITAIAQKADDNTLKFLGIPIDGTKQSMISSLRAKGFTYSQAYDRLTGEFNGKNVEVYIHTNHDLVDRVYVSFPATTESDIKIEFNKLLGQFQKNSKYLALDINEELTAEDDISYEMSVNNKRYQASFYFIGPNKDPEVAMNTLMESMSDYLTPEQIEQMKSMMTQFMGLSEEEQIKAVNDAAEQLKNTDDVDPEKALMGMLALMDGMKSLADGNVWFMIHERYCRYNIGLYYDNLHNQANGEDL